jgi:hypothetical protein
LNADNGGTVPTSKEVVSNKSLSGLELASIILADASRMLEGNGLLSGHMAFGRVSYDLTLTLHLDLPQMPESSDSVRSRQRADDEVRAKPELGAIEPMPLENATGGAVIDGSLVTRIIDSPNLARIEHGLPIEVTVMGQDGHQREQLIEYQPADVGMKPSDFKEPEIVDVTPQVREKLNNRRGRA